MKRVPERRAKDTRHDSSFQIARSGNGVVALACVGFGCIRTGPASAAIHACTRSAGLHDTRRRDDATGTIRDERTR